MDFGIFLGICIVIFLVIWICIYCVICLKVIRVAMPIMLLPKASLCNYVLMYSNILNYVEKILRKHMKIY